jgi:hypothetical protein
MVGIALITPVTVECPFQDEADADVSVEGENVADDDTDAAQSLQDNDGGVLGKNLINASPGKADTINKFYPPPQKSPEPRVDSKTDPARKVQVQGKPYKYKVAAHHLIPGEASLTNSDLYNDYMIAGATFTTGEGNEFKTRVNIGYNVNGNHNGVWLPGNYGIRSSTGPGGKTWSDITDDAWCFEYMRACVDEARGQFHDSHTKYSEAVLKALNAMAVKLALHQDSCDDCLSKKEVDPPYQIKSRLYLFSRYLRGKLRRQPGTWKVPWYTSDRFRDQMMTGGLLSE